ncbi:MAG: hypothetical protein HY077_11310 [Elusimicrobia bacterium]|nr:hypothetical protein [Elusimicrobiota bacterium]
MIVVDPHAFRRLWPALGVWLFLFLTAGDGAVLLKRQFVLARGEPAKGILTAKVREAVPMLGAKRMVAYFRFRGADGRLRTAKEPVGAGTIKAEPVIYALGDRAYLADDLGYSRWKGLFFAAAFAALWLWALARYRFG